MRGVQMKIETIDLDSWDGRLLPLPPRGVRGLRGRDRRDGPYDFCWKISCGALATTGVAPGTSSTSSYARPPDHAGARDPPNSLPNDLYIHEAGRPHMVGPLRLSTYLREEDGGVGARSAPSPEDRLVFHGGYEIENAAPLTAHYTPGHAYHHLGIPRTDRSASSPGRGVARTVLPPAPDAAEIDIEARKRRSKIRRIPRRALPDLFRPLSATWSYL